jgi:hypothetical protein
VNANAHENSDLWIALRGGGNNLGVVTRFDFRTFKQGPVYGGSIYYFGNSFPGQLKALVNELQKPDASTETHLMVSAGFAAMFGPQQTCLNRESWSLLESSIWPLLLSRLRPDFVTFRL